MNEWAAGGVEAAGEERRNLGHVHGGNHGSEAGAKTGDDVAEQENCIVLGTTHDKGANEIHSPRHHNRGAAAIPVGNPFRRHQSKQRDDAHGPRHNIKMEIRYFQVYLHACHRPAYRCLYYRSF